MNLDTAMPLETLSSRKRTLPPDALNETRLRKCRKGTISCWACKKRKVRCNFVKGDSTCDGCKIRDIACISQEFPDESDQVKSNNPIPERLGRVEALLERVIREIGLPQEEHDVTLSLNANEEHQAANTAGEIPTPRLTPGDSQYCHDTRTESMNEHREICLRLL